MTDSAMADSERIVTNLVRHWWVLTAGVLIGGLLGALYAVLAPPTYTADAYVIVVAADPGSQTPAMDFAQAYGRIVDQPQILGRAADVLGTSPGMLDDRVQGSTSPDSPLVELSARARTARLAADSANAVAAQLVAFGNTQTSGTGMTLAVFSEAGAPPERASPVPALDVAVGAATGLLIGGLALLAGASRSAESRDGRR